MTSKLKARVAKLEKKAETFAHTNWWKSSAFREYKSSVRVALFFLSSPELQAVILMSLSDADKSSLCDAAGV